MSAKRLTYKQALAGLEWAVQEKGADYTYERVGATDDFSGNCAYFDPETKKPSCIVGHVFSYAGFTYEDIAAVKTAYLYADPNLSSVTRVADGLFDDRLAESTRSLLFEAQYYQDQGFPWGEALKRAKRAARAR